MEIDNVLEQADAAGRHLSFRSSTARPCREAGKKHAAVAAVRIRRSRTRRIGSGVPIIISHCFGEGRRPASHGPWPRP
jgi:hypothetical protein